MDQLLNIDRSKPFDFKIGHVFLNRCIYHESSKALNLTEIDPLRIQFLSTEFRRGQHTVRLRDWLCNLPRSKKILLDAQVFKMLIENQSCIPHAWDRYARRGIFFPGTIVRSTDRTSTEVFYTHCVLGVYRWGVVDLRDRMHRGSYAACYDST
jgi:hypothetical protein